MPFSYVEMMRELGLHDYAALPCFEPVEAAPLGVPLERAKVGLFASVGAHLPEQEPFEAQNDLSFRLVPLGRRDRTGSATPGRPPWPRNASAIAVRA